MACTCIFGFLAILLPLSGKVYERSRQFRNEFRSCGYWTSNRLVTTCKPFAINISNLYIIRKITTLTFGSLFLGNLVNILVGIRELSDQF